MRRASGHTVPHPTNDCWRRYRLQQVQNVAEIGETVITDFINLTSGIEWIATHGTPRFPLGFVRIQSTACEQKRWAAVLTDLGPTFLMACASGRAVSVFDAAVPQHSLWGPRAIWQGLPWIKYALNRVWHGFDAAEVGVKTHNVRQYFDSVFGQLDPKVRKSLEYYTRFCREGLPVQLIGRPMSTDHDGDYAYFVDRLHDAWDTDYGVCDGW